MVSAAAETADVVRDFLEAGASSVVMSLVADEPSRDVAGTSIPAWWSAEMIADQLLSALPPIEPDADNPAYVAWAQDLLARHREAGSVPLTDDESY